MAKYTLGDIFKGNFRVSQYFGANPAYYQRISGGRLKGHEGVDWATPTGTPLLNPYKQAIVLRTGWDGAYGYYIVLWDNVQRCATWYCHLSRIYVTPGQRLTQGVTVGLTGNTGNSTGPHLHKNFVETDAYGRRLNMTNGYQGFRNVLNNTLVQWVLRRLLRTTVKEEKGRRVEQKPMEGELTPEEIMKKDLAVQKEVFGK